MKMLHDQHLTLGAIKDALAVPQFVSLLLLLVCYSSRHGNVVQLPRLVYLFVVVCVCVGVFMDSLFTMQPHLHNSSVVPYLRGR